MIQILRHQSAKEWFLKLQNIFFANQQRVILNADLCLSTSSLAQRLKDRLSRRVFEIVPRAIFAQTLKAVCLIFSLSRNGLTLF